ncbi:hypothetical protein SESBI_02617 [Sesbania bispinosa]|nr:hypothetical protein SESBI_02617 [Sesbania bispinosa]
MAEVWGQKYTFFPCHYYSEEMKEHNLKIQDAQGVWQEGTKDILKVVESQYRSLFSASSLDDSLNFSDFVPNVISHEINTALEAIPSAVDIQNAVSALGNLRPRAQMV